MNSAKTLNWKDANLEDAVKTTLNKFFYNKRPQTHLKDFFKIVSSNLDSGDNLFSTPWTVSWQVNSNCNLRCKHCFFKENEAFFDNKQDLSEKLAEKMATELINDLNIVTITITGGEPLLRKDIFSLLKKFKSRNIGVCLQTNGTLIDAKKAKVLSEILNPKIDYVQVSLDGATGEIHDNNRGKGIYQKTINGINLLVQNGIPVTVNCTALSTNLSELPDLYKLCCDLGVKKFSLTKFIPCSGEQKKLVPDLKLLIKAISEIVTLSENSSVLFELNAIKIFDLVNDEEIRPILDSFIQENKLYKKPEEDVSCHHHNALYISPQGKIYLCFQTKANNTELGDFKQESLLEIWEKRHKNVFFQKRCSCKMICRKCKYFSLCRGGCTASAYFAHKDINSPDGLCLYSKNFSD